MRKRGLLEGVFLGMLMICFSAQAQFLDPDLNCANAIEIPVNTGVDCLQYARGSFEHAGVIPLGLTCGRAVSAIQKKNLFRFRAIAETHLFSVFDARSDVLPDTRTSFYSAGAVYTDCNFDSPAKICFAFFATTELDSDDSETWYMVLSELVVGQEYYLVLGGGTVIRYNNIDYNSDFRFKVCLRAAEVPYVQIEANDAMTENVDWVEEKFLYSDCDNIFSNIRFQGGDGQNDFNSIGYFNKNNSTFLLEKGIALSTTDLSMNLSAGLLALRFQQNSPAWTGDADLNALQLEIPGQQQLEPSATAVLEFDFIALSDVLDINYLFTFPYAMGRMQYIGIWLTDLTTQNKQNIARVPGTNFPIHQELVIDNYPELLEPSSITSFWNNPLIYWLSNSKVFPTKPTVLTVGRKYRLKFGVGSLDVFFAPNAGFAMFIEDFEQQLNDVELSMVDEADLCTGKPWLIKANTEQYGELKRTISWYKDGVLIAGAHDPVLEVTQSGEYEVRIAFSDINCERSAVISLPSNIHTDVVDPKAIEVCRYSVRERTVDLTAVAQAMFLDNREQYDIEYYSSRADADAREHQIENADAYVLQSDNTQKMLYLRIEQLELECVQIYEIPIIYTTGEQPEQRPAVVVCGKYIFPDLNAGQFYYAQSGGNGENYSNGAILDVLGTHEIYVLQQNTESGCYEESSYTVTIEADVRAVVIKDVLVHCDYFVLPALVSLDSGYYSEPGGKGERLYAGQLILEREKTIYVYAEAVESSCTDQSQFTVTYRDCPVPKGVSPNGDGFNDSWNLSKHGVLDLVIYNRWGVEVYAHGKGYTQQWIGQDKKGNPLASGTYFYVMETFLGRREGWVQLNY